MHKELARVDGHMHFSLVREFTLIELHLCAVQIFWGFPKKSADNKREDDKYAKDNACIHSLCTHWDWKQLRRVPAYKAQETGNGSDIPQEAFYSDQTVNSSLVYTRETLLVANDTYNQGVTTSDHYKLMKVRG